ncbi:hypothetical protein E4T50_07763, partial [Aureobasidium sp. EXF-12298]
CECVHRVASDVSKVSQEFGVLSGYSPAQLDLAFVFQTVHDSIRVNWQQLLFNPRDMLQCLCSMINSMITHIHLCPSCRLSYHFGILKVCVHNVPGEVFREQPPLLSVKALLLVRLCAVITGCKDHGCEDSLVDVAAVEQARTIGGIGTVLACVPDVAPSSALYLEAREISDVLLHSSKGAALEMYYHPRPLQCWPRSILGGHTRH